MSRGGRTWSAPPVAARSGGRARGQALAELALILPLTLVLLLLAGDLARLFGARVTMEGAARAAALEAGRHPTSFQAGQPCDPLVNRVTCAALTEALGSPVTVAPGDVALTCRPSPCREALGSEVEVAIVGHFQLLTPILAPFTGGQSFDLTSDATAQIAVHPVISGASPTPGFDPTPTPAPTPTPTATVPAPTPTPTPTPACFPPISDFSIDPTSGKKKKTTFTFTDQSTTMPDCPLTWSWNFGDGGGDSTSSLPNPTHVYTAQGTYTVSLVVSNVGGSASKTRTVTVTP